MDTLDTLAYKACRINGLRCIHPRIHPNFQGIRWIRMPNFRSIGVSITSKKWIRDKR